jgi:polyhydroxyalkanoate synthesis regulator phasin
MLDIIKKSIYLGLGAATATKETVETLVDELIEKGQLSREKKTGAVQEILDKIEKEEKEISDRIKSAVEKVVAEIGLPTQKNIQELRDRLETLEKKISVK